MENIEIDKQKTQFIREMAELNKRFAINPTFYSVLCSLLLEPEGVSQAQIHKLTGFSSGKISESITDLMRFYPIEKIKLEGIRTKRYKLGVDPEMLMISLYEALASNLGTRKKNFKKLLKKINSFTDSHERFQHLYRLLKEYLDYVTRSIANFEKHNQKFHRLYREAGLGIFDLMKIPDLSEPIQVKGIDFSSNNRDLHKSMEPHHYKTVYLPLKEEFFTLILTTTGDVMPMQRMVALGRIMIELVIEEQYLTKKDIQNATQYKPTILQQVLKQLIHSQAISEKIFEDNKKKKYYIANNRLLASSFRKYRGAKMQVQTMISTIQKYKENTDDEVFKSILQRIEDGYRLYSMYLKYIYYNLEENTKKKK